MTMMKTKKKPFSERIKDALADGYVPLSILEQRLFPESEYPKAHRSAVQGGPPGCRMMLVAALKRLGVPIWVKEPNGRSLIGPYPGESTPVRVVEHVRLWVPLKGEKPGYKP